MGNNKSGWDVQQYTALIVLLALGFLIAVSYGFRGIKVAGVNLSVS